MGNHEYCVDCGASDFHWGRTCQEAYPEGYRETQARKRKQKEKETRQREKAKQVVSRLKKLGYKAERNAYGHVQIPYWTL